MIAFRVNAHTDTQTLFAIQRRLRLVVNNPPAVAVAPAVGYEARHTCRPPPGSTTATSPLDRACQILPAATSLTRALE